MVSALKFERISFPRAGFCLTKYGAPFSGLYFKDVLALLLMCYMSSDLVFPLFFTFSCPFFISLVLLMVRFFWWWCVIRVLSWIFGACLGWGEAKSVVWGNYFGYIVLLYIYSMLWNVTFLKKKKVSQIKYLSNDCFKVYTLILINQNIKTTCLIFCLVISLKPSH